MLGAARAPGFSIASSLIAGSCGGAVSHERIYSVFEKPLPFG
jgi:hypothetical protein